MLKTSPLIVGLLVLALAISSCSSQEELTEEELEEAREEYRDDLTQTRMQIHNALEQNPESQEAQEIMRDFRNFMQDSASMSDLDQEKIESYREKLEEFGERAREVQEE